LATFSKGWLPAGPSRRILHAITLRVLPSSLAHFFLNLTLDVQVFVSFPNPGVGKKIDPRNTPCIPAVNFFFRLGFEQIS
jgi:hypothetical protein